MATETLTGRTLVYGTAEANGDVKAFVQEVNKELATNPVGIFVKSGTTYIVKSRVTGEEYTVSTGKNLADSKVELTNFLISEKILPTP